MSAGDKCYGEKQTGHVDKWMGKWLPFSKVVWEDVTEKETFEQTLVEVKEWVMLLCRARRNSKCKGPAVRVCLEAQRRSWCGWN